MDERQRFEAEMTVRGYSDFSVDEHGKYDGDCCEDLNFAWSVWQSRADQELFPPEIVSKLQQREREMAGRDAESVACDARIAESFRQALEAQDKITEEK